MSKTQYEVTIEKDGARYLVGYTARKSRSGIWSLICQNGNLIGDAIGRFTGTGGLDNATNLSYLTDTGWAIKFSGRTQRDCCCGSMDLLPFIVDIANKAEAVKS